ncbi:MAG: SDR family NAD(P)-dependent oxidoreductase [Planctomycetota bacterium]
MGRRSLKGRRVLLTGASGGIGRELALQLAPFQTRLLLVARREEELSVLSDELKSRGAADVVPIVGDVTDATVRDRAIWHARDAWGGLDVLINNAGISAHGRFENSTPEVLRQIMDVNFFAAAELVRIAVPLLRSGDDALLVNVGSILGHRGVPYNSEYCSSKFALRGWSESIRPELGRDGIALMIVSPGTTDTDFFEHLIAKGEKLPWNEQKGLPPEAVADQIIRGMQRRRFEIYPNWRGRLLVLLTRVAPWLLDRIMNRYG